MMPFVIFLVVSGLLLMFGSLFLALKKADNNNPTYHVERDGKIYVNFFITSKTGGNYVECAFERTEKGYALAVEEKRKILHDLIFFYIFCAVISFIAFIFAFIKTGIFYTPGIFISFFTITVILLFFEFRKYFRCFQYLKKSRP